MTQKIRYASSGDRLSARYVNQIVDAANLAISVLGPPRSKRLPSADSKSIDLDDNEDGSVEGLGTRILTETSRITSTARITDPSDSSVYVDFERIDQITFEASDENLTLELTNP